MIHVDFDQSVGRIKPMHAVGQPPLQGAFRCIDFTPIHYLKDAGIPYSRLHDVGTNEGGGVFVDIPNVFRDFDADETDPASYDFAFTDLLMQALDDYGVKPIYRLGVTIENQGPVKAYNIHPPKDFHKWARICEHIVRHYNEGWANGFCFGVTYWEIWNEPENGVDQSDNQMWTGTKEQFYELFDICAKHLKQCFGDSIKVGGYAATSGFRIILYEPEKYGFDLVPLEKDVLYTRAKYRTEFLFGFFEYLRDHQTPLDFFSWHSYRSVEEVKLYADFLHQVMTKYGYGDVETHINEWNNAHEPRLIGTSYASAQAAAMMLAQQDKTTYMMLYYDAKLGFGSYGGFFDCFTQKPVSTYYVFKAFNELYRLGTQVKCEVDGDGLYAVAATDDKGEKKAVMIANIGVDKTVDLSALKGFRAYVVEKDRFLEPDDSPLSAFPLAENRVVLLKND